MLQHFALMGGLPLDTHLFLSSTITYIIEVRVYKPLCKANQSQSAYVLSMYNGPSTKCRHSDGHISTSHQVSIVISIRNIRLSLQMLSFQSILAPSVWHQGLGVLNSTASIYIIFNLGMVPPFGRQLALRKIRFEGISGQKCEYGGLTFTSPPMDLRKISPTLDMTFCKKLSSLEGRTFTLQHSKVIIHTYQAHSSLYFEFYINFTSLHCSS